jgi:hypothetical protein
MRPIILVPLLLACLPEQKDSGIIVGNPPGLVVARVAKSTDVYVLTVSLESCDGDIHTREIDRRITLTGEQSFEVPAGDWCALIVEVGEDLPLLGTALDVHFAIDLPVREITFEGGFELTDQDAEVYVMELGQPDFIPSDLSDLSADGEDLVISSTECVKVEACIEIRDAIETRSAVYSDVDGDGEIDDDERDGGDVMQGEERDGALDDEPSDR